jgi:hypothetical protein
LTRLGFDECTTQTRPPGAAVPNAEVLFPRRCQY